MITRFLFTILTATIIFSCSDNKPAVPNTDIDVARTFIKDVLTDDLKNAEKLILKNQRNDECFDIIERKYKTFSKEELEGYKNADINIHEISNVSDTVTIVNYSNTYKKEPTKVKMVKVNGQWLVDLQYTFSGNL